MDTNVSTVDGFESGVATVAFVDLAGFSAITDVYGDASAIAVLGRFEELVRQALAGVAPPIKWMGDEAMFGFPDPATALQVLGRLLPACRSEPRIPLTRTGIHHGPVLRRSNDLFGSTVNIAARIAALASPGQLLASRPVADIAMRRAVPKRCFNSANSLSRPMNVAGCSGRLFGVVSSERSAGNSARSCG